MALQPFYDKPDILFTHEAEVRFHKDSDPEPAFVMRSERKMGAWIAEMNRQLGEANVKREDLPLGRTGWAVPISLEEDARQIAQKFFAEIVSERPSLIGDREEPQSSKAPDSSQERVLVEREAIVVSVGEAKDEEHDAEVVFNLAPGGQTICLEVGAEEAIACAKSMFNDVELVIRKRGDGK